MTGPRALLALTLASLAWTSTAAAAVTSRGAVRVTEGVRLSGIQFRTVVKDGELRLDLLLVGRALGAGRSLVLSAAPCRGARPCRVESSRAVRFRKRPRTIVGWHPAFRGAAGISGLRIRVAERGGRASRATADVLVAPTAWTIDSYRTSLSVREDRAVPVDALRFAVVPVAGGGARVTGSFTVRSARAFDVRTRLGACTVLGGACPPPDVTGTAAIPAGRTVTVPIAATLAPTAGAQRVRFRADGGVFPSPFVTMVLPWPPA